MTKEAAAKLATELAKTAVEKRALQMDQLLGWFQSLPPEMRSALIGGLVGGAGTGAVSAATGGSVLSDALMGTLLGGLAGGGGRKVYDLVRGQTRFPSQNVAPEDWKKIQETARVPSMFEPAARFGAAGAGTGLAAELLTEKPRGLAYALREEPGTMAAIRDRVTKARQGMVSAAHPELAVKLRGAEQTLSNEVDSLRQLVAETKAGLQAAKGTPDEKRWRKDLKDLSGQLNQKREEYTRASGRTEQFMTMNKGQTADSFASAAKDYTDALVDEETRSYLNSRNVFKRMKDYVRPSSMAQHVDQRVWDRIQQEAKNPDVQQLLNRTGGNRNFVEHSIHGPNYAASANRGYREGSALKAFGRKGLKWVALPALLAAGVGALTQDPM